MIRMIAVGRVKEPWMRDGISEYMKRLKAYEKVEIVEVEDEKAPESNSDKENEAVKKKEGERILKALKEDEYVILLDLAGREMDSVDLSRKLSSLYTEGHSKIAFVIGGSLGLSPEVIKRADVRWKLSSCTFPHQLCRVIVLEQIYRAFRIMRNEPYHK